MSFQPALPFNSVTGFKFLQRTQERQLEAFVAAPQIQRDIAYFRENITNAASAEDLISDPRLLRVALTAFGLGEATNQQAFVRRALEDGTVEPTAFANRLADRRYTQLAQAFSYGNPGGAPIVSRAFQEDVIARYQILAFEEAVGEVDLDQRLALGFVREAEDIAGRDLPDRTLWLQLLGSRALRQVVETGFNLPQGFVNLDLDQQVEVLREQSLKQYGSASPKIFQDPDIRENFVSRFFIRRDLNVSVASPASVALTLLTSGPGLGNLVQSNF